ncbi:hypothetical protein ABT158_48845 [Nonomuraea sp. NPDC001636]|uniref:hypothetical protein n=1 Tax=Nonomuraea sp. NPDC001636 TaxID=3154391 RepID=UPI0033174B76
MTDPVRRPEWYSSAQLDAYQLDPRRGSVRKTVLVAGERIGSIEPIRSDATGAVVGWKARRLSGLTVPRASTRYARAQGEAVQDLIADLHGRWQDQQSQPVSEQDADAGLKPPLAQEERSELLRRYTEDLDSTVAEIAADFDVSTATVYRLASDAGVHRPNRRGQGRLPKIRLTDEQMADLRASYPTAESTVDIARRLGIKVEQLARIASREGLRRPK